MVGSGSVGRWDWICMEWNAWGVRLREEAIGGLCCLSGSEKASALHRTAAAAPP